MAQESLKQKTVNGVVWSSIDNFAALGISFIFSIILARILSPEDYGTIALLTVFISVSNAFINSGFSHALIRKPDLTERDNSTAFYFNIVVGFVCYFVIYLIAPLVAKFYNLPIITSLLRVVGLTVIFSSLAIVQQAQLTIGIDFKKQAVISVVSALLSGGVGLFFALKGFGVWSLAFHQVSGGLIRTILFWCIVKWRPREKFSKESFHYLFGFGGKLLAVGLIDEIWKNLYPIIIGKFFSPASLGLYSRAHTFSSLPASNLTNVLQRVTFPVLSKIQNDDERLALNYRRLLKMSAFVIFPIMIGLAALAKPVVIILLTEKWEGCIIYLQILCFALMWYPIHAINLNLLQVKGRSDLFLKLEIIKKIVLLVVLVATIRFGLVAMCFGQIVSSLFGLIINTYYTGKLIKVGFFMQMKDLLPTLIVSILMSVGVYFITLVLPNYWLQLIVGFIIGVFFYYSMARIRKAEELKEVFNIIKKK